MSLLAHDECYPHTTNMWLLINPYPIKLIDLYFQSLEVVSRYRDPQPQVVEITHVCLILDQAFRNLDV